MKTLLHFFICFFMSSAGTAFAMSPCPAPQTFKQVLLLMGSRFEITTVCENEALADKAIETAITEIRRIENLISSWDSNSETCKVISHAGVQPVKVSKELFELIRRSKKVSELTDGAFDISYASMDNIWQFDGSMTELPSKDVIKASVSKVNHQNIILNEEDTTVFLKEKGMKIGFGAIGKGYAANQARNVMQEMGIQSGVVNAGGDLVTWGNQESGRPWRIGIADPANKTNVISWLEVSEMAVVTSGNYEKFAEIDDKRYAHIINPKTGWPATGLKSVTIICPDTELADALATAIFVMGEKEGMSLINQLKTIECIIINENNEIKTSDKLQLNYYDASDSKSLDYKIGRL